MGFSIQLLGKFSLTKGTAPEPIPTRSYGRIYALLALRMKSGINRKELIQKIWPDLDSKTASNRLRVALTTFRREMGPAFLEDEDRIGLNRELVEVDFFGVLQVLSTLEDEVDELEELRLLEAQIDLFGLELLPEFDDEWAEEERAGWTGIVLESVRRISQLAAKLDDHRLAVRAIEAGFVHDPYDEGLWRQYLEASTLLGEKAKALARFSQVRRIYNDSFGHDFQPETIDFATNLRDSPFSFAAKGEQPLSPKEVELFTRVVATVLKDEPDIARALFGARPTFFEEASVPEVSLPLLTRLSQDTNDRSVAWQKCTLNLLSLHANRGDLEQIITLGQQILDVSEDAVVRGTTLAYLSFAHLTKLDYGNALSTIERCIETLVESDHDDEAKTFYMNKASALVGLGRYREAAHLAQEGLAFFVQMGTAIGDIRVCEYRHTLAFCQLLMEQDEDAYAEARQVIDMTLARQYEPAYGNGLSLASYIVYKVSRNPSAVDTAIMSLKSAYRSGNVITQHRALEYIAGIIQEAGLLAEAKELIDYANQWRSESGTPRQHGHQVIVDRIIAACGDEPAAKNLQKASPRDILTYGIQVLRQIQ